MSLPSDYDIVSDGRHTYVVRSDWKEPLLEDLRSDFARVPHADRRAFTGRVRHFSYRPEGRDDRLLVRRVVRGGVVARLLGDLHWGMSRPFAELAAVVRARAAGLNVPEVVAVRASRAWGPFYRFTLVVKEIDRARDLLSLAGELGAAERRRAIAEVAEAVRRMHEAGLYHGDLNVKNILLSDPAGRCTVYLIDLDRAVVRDARVAALDLRNLARLNRSVEKWLGGRVTRTDKYRFLLRYLGSRERVRDVARRCGAGLWIHRLWWSLTGARA
jgi:tRNA A-37 threonylcarbamoyl transferase component Bud32